MKFAYADPPYLGCAKKLYGDPTYDDPEAHRALISRLCDEFPDGWVLSMHTPSITALAPMLPSGVRWGAWIKPFASFKPGVNPAFCWEPVAFLGGRKKRSRKVDTVRDFQVRVSHYVVDSRARSHRGFRRGSSACLAHARSSATQSPTCSLAPGQCLACGVSHRPPGRGRRAPMTERRYVYRGDRLTDPALKGAPCVAVLREDGKCVRGRGNMLVQFDGEDAPRVVLARQLRKVEALTDGP